jgi:predicted protein tyrosine phosphatase
MAEEWSVKIERVDNGWRVTPKGGEHHTELVFQDKAENGDGEKASFVEAVQEAIDFFAMYGTKHDKKRIVIGYSEKWTEIQNLLFP